MTELVSVRMPQHSLQAGAHIPTRDEQHVCACMQGPGTAADVNMLQSSLHIPSPEEHAMGAEDDSPAQRDPLLAPDTIALAQEFQCLLQLPPTLPQDWTQLFDSTLFEFPPAPIPEVWSPRRIQL